MAVCRLNNQSRRKIEKMWTPKKGIKIIDDLTTD